MITMDKEYVYRNGEKARVLCVDRPFSDNLVVLSMRPNGAIVQSDINGKAQCHMGEFDLIEVWTPTKGEVCYFWDNEKPRSLIVTKFDEFRPDSMFKFRAASGAGYKHCAKFTPELPVELKC